MNDAYDDPDLALEPRVMFDAGGAADLADMVIFAPQDVDESIFPEDSFFVMEPPESAPLVNIYVIDMSLEDAGVLIDDLPDGAEVIKISAQANGVEYLADALSGRNDIDALHILSHGSAGSLQLGTDTLTADSLIGEHNVFVRSIGESLTIDGDILIYGCDFGAGDKGKLAAGALATLTGADVAASDDLTGAAALGANWQLEVELGDVEAEVFVSAAYTGALSVEATDGILTIKDSDNTGGTITLTDNGEPTSSTNIGTTRGVEHMVERIWQYSENSDKGEQTLVFDISTFTGAMGSTASDFAIVLSTASDLSTDPLVLRASGFDAANGLVFFHGVNLANNTHVGMATQTEVDNISIAPVIVIDEEQVADLSLVVQPDLTDGGTLPDTFDTATGYRAEGAAVPTTFNIPAGSTNISITAYSNEPGNTSGNDTRNDDYQTMNVSLNLSFGTTSGTIAYIIDQGPDRNDQFGWTDAPLGTDVLAGGTVTGNIGSNISPTFEIVDGVLQITENHGMQTSYLVEFQTTLNTSSNFLGSAAGLADIGNTDPIVIDLPAGVDSISINQTDAAAGNHSAIEYKGFSRHVINVADGTGSGTTMAQLGETNNRVTAFTYDDYTLGTGDVLTSGATIQGDSASTVGAVNNLEYKIVDNQLIIERDPSHAAAFNSMFTVEFYDRVDLGSSADTLGSSSDTTTFDASPGTPEAELSFDVPEGTKLGILNLSMGGTRTSNENENTGGAFVIIDLENGTTSGNFFGVRVSNKVDLLSWESVPFGTTMFDVSTGAATGGEASSNHSSLNQFNDKFAGNARFEIVTNGDGFQTVKMFTNSSDGTQTWRDYNAYAQTQWIGSEPIRLTGLPAGGSFNIGELDPVTNEWVVNINEAATQGLFFTTPEHFSGELPLDLTVSVGPETDSTLIVQRPVLDPVDFNGTKVTGDENTQIPISVPVQPTLTDGDGSETITSTSVSNLEAGHTITDGVNRFTASAGSTSVDVSSWTLSALTYFAGTEINGDFAFNVNVNYQDTGAGQTLTGSATGTIDICISPVNDAPIAMNEIYSAVVNVALVVPVATGVRANETDPEGDTLLISIVTGPANGSVTLNADGSFSYTGTTVGADSFVYEIDDQNGNTVQATATIIVDAAPPPIPVVMDDTRTTLEDTPITFDILGNDTVNSGGLTFQTQPANGSVVQNANGTITYTPDLNFNGVETFNYTLTNVSGTSTTATVTINVSPDNDAPIALDESATTPEDTAIVINAAGNDTDVDGDAVVISGTPTLVSGLGAITAVTGGSYTFTPAPGFSGTAVISYIVTDNLGGTDTAQTTITVTSQLDAPVSADATVTTLEDTVYVIQTSDIAFSDEDGDTLQTVKFDLPSTGTLLVNGAAVTTFPAVVTATDITNGLVSYLPPVNVAGVGLATIEFTVNDGQLDDLTPNTLTVDVTPVNDPIGLTNTLLTDQSLTDGDSGVSIQTSGAFDDPDNMITGYAAVITDGAGAGTTLAALGLAINLTTGEITGAVDHLASANGPYSIAVTATSADASTTTDSFLLSVDNPIPTATAGGPYVYDDGETITAVDIGALFTDADGGATGDTITLSLDSGTLPGSLTFSPTTGLLTGTIDNTASINATYTAVFRGVDEQGAATTTSVSFTINNPAPTLAVPLVDLNQTSADATAVTNVDLSTAFVDDDTLTFAISGLPNGLTADANGVVTGTLDNSASQDGVQGAHTVTVIATDTQGQSTETSFTWLVTNPEPTVVNEPAKIKMADGTTSRTGLVNVFNDVDLDDLTITASVVGASPGTVDIVTNASGNPILRVVANGDASTAVAGGTYLVTLIADDGEGGTISTQVEICVNNPPPVVDTAVASQTNVDNETVSVSVASLFTDTDNDTVILTASGLPTGLTLTGTMISGTIDNSASQDANNPFTVTVTAMDADGGVGTYDFIWTITNPAPIAVDIADQTGMDATALNISLPAIFTDSDGDVLGYSVASDSTDVGTLNIGLIFGIPTITGTPGPNASVGGVNSDGVYEVTVTANDGEGGTVSESFSLTIDNIPPTSTGLTDQTLNDGAAVSIEIVTAGGFVDALPDTDPLTYTVTGLPTGLTFNTTGPNANHITGTLDHLASDSSPYTITVVADDGQGGTVSESFVLTVNNPPPVATSLADQQYSEGQAGITLPLAGAFSDADGGVAGDGLTYVITGLPDGLTLDTATGIVSGTLSIAPNQNGDHPVFITATDEQGAAATVGFIMSIQNVPPMVIELPAPTYTDNVVIPSYDATVGFSDPGGGLTFTYSGTLPAGLTFTNGVITGTPTINASQGGPGSDGLYPLTIIAEDTGGATASQAIVLTILNPAPTAVDIPNQTVQDGGTLTFDVATAGAFADEDALTYTPSQPLPAWLSLSTAGVLTATSIPNDASATSPYAVSVTASDNEGGTINKVFNVIVENPEPTSSGLSDQTYEDGDSVTLSITSGFSDADTDVLTYNTTSTLPDGLTLNLSTGEITGQIGNLASVTGSYAITIVATDAQGATASADFNITVTNPAPQVTGTLPDQTFVDGATVTIATGQVFNDLPDGDNVTFQVGGLPVGLTINPDTGEISGTLPIDTSVNGPYVVTVLAEDEQGAQTEAMFTINVSNLTPVVTALPDVTYNDSQVVSLNVVSVFSDPDGDDLAYTVTGLPTGLTFSSTTGLITGTLPASTSQTSPFSITVTANDNEGGVVSTGFMITVNNPVPTANDIPDQTVQDAGTLSFDVAAAGSFSDEDTLTYSATTPLPSWLSLSTAGVLTATSIPADASVNSPYTVSVTANDNEGGTVTKVFDIIVENPVPTANDIPDQTVQDAGTLSFDVAAAGSFSDEDTLTYSATTPLPSWLSLSTAGVLTATSIPADASVNSPYTVSVTANDNEGGTVTKVFDIIVENPVPTATNLPDQSYEDGDIVNLPIAGAFSDPDMDVLTYSTTSPLPDGLMLNASSGVISGQISNLASATGTYPITIVATDAQGAAASEDFVITISNPAPEVTGTLPDQIFVDDQTVSILTAQVFDDLPDGDTVTFEVAGLPTGLSINPTTGEITGTLPIDTSLNGPYVVTVRAVDQQGAQTETMFTIAVNNPQPEVTSLPDVTYNDSDTVSLNVVSVFFDPDGDNLTYSVTGLPTGLTFDPATGLVSGTLPASTSQSGPFNITVTANDGEGGVISTEFVIAVNNPNPVGQSLADTGGLAGTEIDPIAAAGVFSDPDGDLLTFSATGLPPGLIFNPTTGLITGTPAPTLIPDTEFVISITATDVDGAAVTVSFSFIIGEESVPPFIGTSPLGGTFGGTDLLDVYAQTETEQPQDPGSILLDALNDIQQMSFFDTRNRDTPILQMIEDLNFLSRDLDLLHTPGYTNSFPIGFAFSSGSSEPSGLTANVLIGDQGILYQVEALDGRTVKLSIEDAPDGVLSSSEGVIILSRWMSLPFNVTIELIEGDQIEVLEITVDPRHHEFEILVTQVRDMLLSERLNWSPSMY